MSRVSIDSAQDVLYIVTWEYNATALSFVKKKGWIEETFVTKNRDAFDKTFNALTMKPLYANSFRNVRGFVMKAEEVFP